MPESCSLVLIAGEASNVGKTTLGEKLASTLARRGWCIAAVKHVHHGVDYRVKDTGRYMAAGASRVVAVGPGEYMVVARGSLPLSRAVELAAAGCSTAPCRVVVEGFREMAAQLAPEGWCVAFLAHNSVRISWPGGRLAAQEPGEAAERLAGLVASGACMGRRNP